MDSEKLTPDERKTLLGLARSAIEAGVRGERPPRPDLSALGAHLAGPGASFVTLTIAGQLRGCIGALEAYQPLARDVCEHAAAAALEDPRFPPLGAEELPRISIEVSRLTSPVLLEYATPEELIARLRPNVDGVIVRDGFRRATFLPQVWEKIPDPAEFMDNLCYKMGADPHTWRYKPLEVQVYQVEEFHE